MLEVLLTAQEKLFEMVDIAIKQSQLILTVNQFLTKDGRVLEIDISPYGAEIGWDTQRKLPVLTFVFPFREDQQNEYLLKAIHKVLGESFDDISPWHFVDDKAGRFSEMVSNFGLFPEKCIAIYYLDWPLAYQGTIAIAFYYE